MEREVIKRIIIEILSEKNFGIKMPADFSPEGPLFLKGIIDSFGIVLFITELQERFGVKIENREVYPGNFESIEKITTFIHAKISKGTKR